MFFVAAAETKLQLIAGIVLYGLAQGATSPTLLAWATDLSDPEKKGRGVSSLYIFMELGIGLGAFTSGLVYANRPERIFETFLICSILALFAVFFLSLEKFSRKWKV